MTLTDAIRRILTDPATDIPAETTNALHAATDGHPWCAGKDLEQRRLEVLYAIAGRTVHPQHSHNVIKATKEPT